MVLHTCSGRCQWMVVGVLVLLQRGWQGMGEG